MTDWNYTAVCHANAAAAYPGAMTLDVYDAAIGKGKRRQPTPTYLDEDSLLSSWTRALLTESGRDLQRNFALVRWMVNMHLNYVARFNFQAATSDKKFNEQLEKAIARRSTLGACDVTGRESLRSFVRGLERHRVVDGDYLVMFLKGGWIQGVEGERVRNPNLDEGTLATDVFPQWIGGVEVDRYGRHRRYAVHRRAASSFELETIVPANKARLLGYRDRTDQIRGVGLLAAALTYLSDGHENINAALMKSKVQSLFAMVFQSSLDLAGDGEGTEPGRRPYKVEFGRGPAVMNLFPGDDAKFLTTSAVDKEWREFMVIVILLALKALDLPYCALDEAHTNYSGHRAAWIHYEESCRDKRETLREFLDDLTRFWIAIDVQEGRLVLPSGMKVEELRWNWIPPALPWWKPQEEIYGELAQISAGMTTFEEVCRRRGTGELYENIDRNAKAMQYAEAAGFPLVVAPPGSTGKSMQSDREPSA